jgi:hypothetical protein
MPMSRNEIGQQWFGFRHGQYKINVELLKRDSVLKLDVREFYNIGLIMKIVVSGRVIFVRKAKYIEIVDGDRTYQLSTEYCNSLNIEQLSYISDPYAGSLSVNPTIDISQFKRRKIIINYALVYHGEKRIYDHDNITRIYYDLHGSRQYTNINKKSYHFHYRNKNITIYYKHNRIEEIYEEYNSVSGKLLSRFHKYKGVIMANYRVPKDRITVNSNWFRWNL